VLTAGESLNLSAMCTLTDVAAGPGEEGDATAVGFLKELPSLRLGYMVVRCVFSIFQRSGTSYEANAILAGRDCSFSSLRA
jgi:hypothetical protein